MCKWFPPELNVTASFAAMTGGIELQLHDSHRARVVVGDGFRLAGWIFGTEEYDFHDVPYLASIGGPTARHHHWRGVYDRLAVTIVWVETITRDETITHERAST